MTYQKLVADIIAYSENNGAKFKAAMPTIISNGLRSLSRTLSLELYNRDAIFALTPAVPLIEFTKLAEPVDPVVVDYLMISNGDFIERRSMAYLRAYGGRGTPRFFADVKDGVIMLAPTPITSVVVTMTYLTMPVLTEEEPENWYSQNVYDLLFNTCMAEAQRFLLAGEISSMFQTEANRLLIEARRDHADQLRRVYQPLAIAATPKEKTVAT